MSLLSPFQTGPLSERAQVHGVLTDIDDTLTTEGAITPDALDALHRLRAAGLPVFAITGRPAGWSEAFALAWPVNAIVAENGAVALSRGADGQLCRDLPAGRDHPDRQLRPPAGVPHSACCKRMPQARLATDSPGRETDIAIDHSEFAHLDRARHRAGGGADARTTA